MVSDVAQRRSEGKPVVGLVEKDGGNLAVGDGV